jgi:hypothetical protein
LYHPEEVREKIRTSQLVNRLNAYANSKVELAPAQVTAILGLLKKTMPDLQAITISGDPKRPIEISVTDAKL